VGTISRSDAGSVLSEPACSDGWDAARQEALAEAPAAAGEAAWNLPHDSLSAWLNTGVEASRAAEWAGSSVSALLRACTKVLSGIRVGRPQENPGSCP
jgi:hypothetical protein